MRLKKANVTTKPLRPDEPVLAHGFTQPCPVLIGEASETRVRRDLVTRQLAVLCLPEATD